MFELPFRVDSPLAVAFFLLPVVCLLFYLVRLLKNEKGRFRRGVDFLVLHCPLEIPKPRLFSLIRTSLIANAFLLGLMMLFGFMVGTGIIRNKEIKPLTIEDIYRFEKEMEKRGIPQRSDSVIEGMKKDLSQKTTTEKPAE